MVRFFFKIVDSPLLIKKKINIEFVRELNKRFTVLHLQALRTKVGELIELAINQSPEYQSLLGGDLQGELGVPAPFTGVSAMISIFKNSIKIIPSPFRIAGNVISGGFSLVAVESSFKDVIYQPGSIYITEKGTVIPWLQWLLLEGDKIIVKQYFYINVPRFNFLSRTGQGIMLPALSGNLSVGGWRVPPQYSGIISDNWITRALVGKSGQGGIIPAVQTAIATLISIGA